MAVVAVLDIHMERNMVGSMNPSINIRGLVPDIHTHLNPHLHGPWVHIEYSIPELQNVLKNLWKHYCFINLNTYVERQYFGVQSLD